jgi:NAD(P)-dependent dehydrogenase (short-subunit alcohol dehydrogenase family)
MDPRVVVVTGASAGVGRAVAHEFAQQGCAVALLARDRTGLDSAAEEVRALGGQADVIALDVSDAEAVEAAADQVESVLGPIDVWVNDAMATVFAPFADVTPEEFRRVTEVTYLGTVYGTMAALRRMKPRDRGTIVQVGSALAYRSIPLQSAYCGAKFGIRGFTDSVRTELLHDDSNLWITMVQLPAVNTPQFDWGRTKMPRQPMPVPPIFEPEVAAKAVRWAASHRRREVVVGGSAAKAILAAKIAPGLADRYLARNGYDAQQEPDQLVDPDRPSNLFHPVEGKAATRGRFGRRARPRSYQLWLNTHRGTLAVAGLSAVGMLAAGRVRRASA